ncbi:MAG: hypothetical protein BGO05_28435 [Rhizobiales bacterium 63-7]|uniref:Polyketide cyclase n=1 Tax=Bosea spartocytisi TaxID=2773451 RepID=A0A927ECP6_9HYPH|nr:hypothetical protein [Bosea spartocytisi]MBD3846289.1 hypothetical protein [Bosea spartocytisi]MBN9034104.1 hypothetical protein [Hyphomicrobiales bacterium]OJU66056.1 MAG: hypothetical protein BGO05_28435 [Rhizobiales bacterium 63-7]
MSNSPEMICDTIRVERLLKASPARVFAALTDHEARRRWEPTPEGITAGPVARCSPILTGIASQTGKSVAQLVLRLLIQKDGVVALSETVGEDPAAENLAIFDFERSPEVVAAIDSLARRDDRLVCPRAWRRIGIDVLTAGALALAGHLQPPTAIRRAPR